MDLYMIWIITSKMVINHELQWFILKESVMAWKKIFFYGNIEGFPVGKSDSELLGLLYSKMLGVSEYTKVGGELDYKEGTSIGVYAWSVESITEVNMLGFIAICLKCSLLGMFQWYSKIVKE